MGGDQTVDQKADAPSADQKAERLDKILTGVAVVASILSLPLLGLVFYALTVDTEPDLDETARASEVYFDGVEALQHGQWERAYALFEKSRDADPDFGDVDAQLDRIEREKQAAETIENARESAEDGLDDEIRRRLRTIPRESHYFDEARSLLSLARHNEAQRLFDRAQQAYGDGEYDRARTVLNELQAVAPQHEQARSLEESIAARRDEETEQPDETATPQPSSPPDRAPEPRDAPETDEPDSPDTLDDPFAEDIESAPSDTDAADDSPGSINFIDGFTKYRAGRFDDAIAHFESIADKSSGTVAERARTTADDVRTFAESRQQARTAIDEGRYNEAVDALENARQADEAVAGDGGSFESEIAEQMAVALTRKGRQRLEADDYSTAYDLLQRARAHDPHIAGVETLADDLENQAQSLYIQAANQRKSDPEGAARLGETILTMVPPASEIHERTSNLLEDLEQ